MNSFKETPESPEPEPQAGQLPDKQRSLGSHVDAIDLAIRSTLPKRPGQRNKLVFELARALKAVPGLSDAGFDQLQPLVRQWHNLAKPFIGTPAFEETLADFIHGWPRVKFPKGKEPMANIIAAAFAAEPPECVRHYESEPLRQLASVCRELQRATGEAPFYLATRTVGQYFRVDPSTASRWLKLLEVDRVIEVAEKGSQKTGRASRFRFRGTSRPASTPTTDVEQQPPASASCSKPEPSPKQPSIFAKLTNADLRDDATLLSWFDAATQRKNPVVRDNETDRLNVFAAAERALEVGDNPAALFAHIVGEHQWNLISCEQEDRGHRRLRRLLTPEMFRRPERGDDAGTTSEPIRAGDMLRDFVSQFQRS